MKRAGLMIGLAVLVVVGLLAALLVFNWVLGPTLAASGEMTAIPVVPVESTQAATEPAPTEGANTRAPTNTAESAATPVTEATAESAAAELMVLELVPEQSEVRFILSELLRGQPTTVVGATNQIAGQIAVNPSDLSTAQVGIIQVNARELATDSNQRNRAIRNFILNTDSYEFITFTPTEVIGLDGGAQPGDTFTFQLAGDLTIRNITQPVVFEVTAAVDSLNQLSGTAVTTVQRSAYNLQIPSVPQVADVSEEVRVELDFVAAGS